MAEYIKLEALKDFPIRKDHCDKERANEHFIFGIESVLEYAENLPAADVVPVVRCKDCKYYRVSAMLAPNKFCFRLKHPVEDRPIGYNFAPDDFCSHGERKDDDSDALD